MRTVTKRDIAEFYASIAGHMLRYLANRPLTLVRCEKGITRADALRTECKFLRHAPGWHRWVKAPIRRIAIPEQKKIGEYLVVDSPEELLGLVQGDIVEVHVWNAKADALERPDRLVFDLDPGPHIAWSKVVEAAELLRKALAGVGLRSWPKLSGGRGLHVVVPFRNDHAWEPVYTFARTLAEGLVAREPALLTAAYEKQHRTSKILLDYKRNHRAAVTIAAYSTRARPNATVSAPVSWRELKAGVQPDAFTVLNFKDRLRPGARDPWREFWKADQRLDALALRRP